VPRYDRFWEHVAEVQAAHPDVELHLVWTGGDAVTLHLIRTLPVKRGQGLAEAALRDVLALADQWHVPVRLVAEPLTGDTDTDLARLITWYQRHGFTVLGPARPGDDAVIMQRAAPS
jgi:GNAT superfamily N-acetyltransferase